MLVFSHGASAQIGIGISLGFAPPPLPVYDQPICSEDGYIWTPGYWGWGGSSFVFYDGYWGPQVGFYGGINYGFGYEGGRWEGGCFLYNTYVNHVDTTIIHNTYNTRITNVTENHVALRALAGAGGDFRISE